MACRQWLLGIMGLALGCGDERLRLSIDVRSDLVPGREFASVRTVVEGEAISDAIDVQEGLNFADGVRVTTVELLAGEHRVRVSLLDAEGREVQARPVDLTLRQDFAVTVALNRSCLHVTCSPDSACFNADCVSPRCTAETTEACGESLCESDLDCRIGLCNGQCVEEVCESPPLADCRFAELSSSPSGARANGGSGRNRVSVDYEGTAAVFVLAGDELSEWDENATRDVYFRDFRTGEHRLVSRPSDGGLTAGTSDRPVISGDGRWVAFRSQNSELTGDAVSAPANVYLWERRTGRLTLLSVNSAGEPFNSGTEDVALSYDGRFVVLRTDATNVLGSSDDPAGAYHVYWWDRESGVRRRITEGGDPNFPANELQWLSVSRDGTRVGFLTAEALVSEDTNRVNDAYVAELEPELTYRLISLLPSGAVVSDEPGALGTQQLTADLNLRSFVYETFSGSVHHPHVHLEEAVAPFRLCPPDGDVFCREAKLGGDGRFVATSLGAPGLMFSRPAVVRLSDRNVQYVGDGLDTDLGACDLTAGALSAGGRIMVLICAREGTDFMDVYGRAFAWDD